MSEEEAIGFIGECCIRMYCMVVLIAESVVPNETARAYIEKQRAWIEQKQEMFNIMNQINKTMGCDGDE